MLLNKKAAATGGVGGERPNRFLEKNHRQDTVTSEGTQHFRSPRHTSNVIKTLVDWHENSQPGDWARAIWSPIPTAQACYGADLPQHICEIFPAVLARGDVGFVRTRSGVYVVMPHDCFEAILDGVAA